MGTAAGMLAEARKSLGIVGRPNKITRAYAARNGSYFLTAPWCDMSITEWARASGNHGVVCPGGDRAYTVWHAQDFQKINRWYSGTVENLNKARPGDIVFFDWGGSNSVGAIDHVGIIEKVLGDGRVQTIEGNTANACKRKVRSASSIAGYGRPAYSGSGGGSTARNWTEAMVKKLPTLKRGSKGEDVQSLQGLLRARSHNEVVIDGEFGETTEKAVKAVQRWGDVADDGVVGPDTWPVMLRVHE